MSNKILEITEKQPKPVILPNGSYSGVWCGSNIDVKHNGREYQLRTEQGIRGMANVVVTISGEELSFTELKN
jgi:hypothetical protein